MTEDPPPPEAPPTAGDDPGAPPGDPGTAPGDPGTAPGLSAQDLAVLDLAARNWTGPGPRERAIRERLGISPAAYFQVLNALLDDPRALRHAPTTVNRLRAQRARFRAERSESEAPSDGRAGT